MKNSRYKRGFNLSRVDINDPRVNEHSDGFVWK